MATATTATTPAINTHGGPPDPDGLDAAGASPRTFRFVPTNLILYQKSLISGHLCVDALLSAVGRKMYELIRDSDIKVRYGGEEFLIMLPDTSLPGAIHVARILKPRASKLSV